MNEARDDTRWRACESVRLGPCVAASIAPGTVRSRPAGMPLRSARLCIGHGNVPATERPPLDSVATPVWRGRVLYALLVLGALLLRTWDFTQIGWGNEYYAAAARSMAANWHNFAYAAFDPAGFISVDKPPLALWIDALCVRMFGFTRASVLLPHAVAGAAAVGVLVAIVRRCHGPATALLAGLFLALMPVSVATDRTNLTDSLLVLVLLVAAWALLVATERAERGRLLLAFALVGVAFNVKMLAAGVVAPAFAGVYLWAAPGSFRRRIGDLVLAGAVALLVSMPWLLFVEFTPATERPYVGSSRTNSVFDLVLGYNGLGRFVVRARGNDTSSDPRDPARPSDASGDAQTASAGRSRAARLFVRTPAGPFRLLDGQLAAQALWLLPLALVGVATAFSRPERTSIDGAARAWTATGLWSAWFITAAVVYSFAAGIFHFYYVAALAPAVAALAAIGVATAWRVLGGTGWRGVVLPVALVVTAVWQVFVQFGAIDASDTPAPEWMRQIGWMSFGIAAVTAAVLFSARERVTEGRGMTRCWSGAAIGIAALLVLPAAWSSSSVLVPANGVVPSADLLRLDGSAPPSTAGRERFVSRLAAFLQANRHGERFLVATSTSQLAAAIIVATGEPVMARGGFHGQDPALTPDSLAQRVAAGDVRFAFVGDMSAINRRFGPGQVDVVAWIRAHGTPVDPALWRGAAPRTIELYDLRGSPPLVASSTAVPR